MRDRGSAPLELAAGIGLLLIPAVLLVLSFAPWVERQMGARELARNVARAAAVAGSVPDAEALIAQATHNYGIERADISVRLSGDAGRGGLVTANVTVQMPVISIPGIGGLGSVSWTVHHTEQVDLYRSFP